MSVGAQAGEGKVAAGEPAAQTQHPASGASAAAPDYSAQISKLQSENAGLRAEHGKASKAYESLQKRIEDGSLVKEHLGKMLGLGKEEDPKAALDSVSKAKADAESAAAMYRGKLLNSVSRQHVSEALLAAGVNPKALKAATVAFLEEGAPEIDEGTLSLKDGAALNTRATAFMASNEFFKAPAAAASNNAQPITGKPTMPAPAAPNGAGMPVFVDFTDAMNVPINQLQAAVAAQKAAKTRQ